MSRTLIEFVQAGVKANGLEKTREHLLADLKSLRAKIDNARAHARGKDWTECQQRQYVQAVTNKVMQSIQDHIAVAKVYLGIENP